MRGPTLLISMLALGLAVPAAAGAQVVAEPPPAPTEAPSAPSVLPPPVLGAGTGGAGYDEAAPDPTLPIVEGTRAVRLPNGLAAAPAAAPPRVQRAIWAANEIVGLPYRYGGGHNRTFRDTGYDCSGTVSYALRGAGLLEAPMPSGSFMSWGESGKGEWITVYAHGGHAYVVIAGLRLDTSAAGERVSSGKGPRWRSSARRQRGYRVRHPVGF